MCGSRNVHSHGVVHSLGCGARHEESQCLAEFTLWRADRPGMPQSGVPVSAVHGLRKCNCQTLNPFYSRGDQREGGAGRSRGSTRSTATHSDPPRSTHGITVFCSLLIARQGMDDLVSPTLRSVAS